MHARMRDQTVSCDVGGESGMTSLSYNFIQRKRVSTPSDTCINITARPSTPSVFPLILGDTCLDPSTP